MNKSATAVACVLVLALPARPGPALASGFGSAQDPEQFPDATGAIATYSTSGSIDSTGAFFQSLGTNGRSCSTCHVASQAFGLGAADVRARYASSGGHDVLFAAIDGAN